MGAEVNLSFNCWNAWAASGFQWKLVLTEVSLVKAKVMML